MPLSLEELDLSKVRSIIQSVEAMQDLTVDDCITLMQWISKMHDELEEIVSQQQYILWEQDDGVLDKLVRELTQGQRKALWDGLLEDEKGE